MFSLPKKKHMDTPLDEFILLKEGGFNDEVRSFIDAETLSPVEVAGVCIWSDAERTFRYVAYKKLNLKHSPALKTKFLFDAIENNARSIVSLLLDKNKYNTDPNSHLETKPLLHAIQVAVRQNKFSITKSLVEAGATLGIVDPHNETLSMMAARNNNFEIFKLVYLFDDLNAQDPKGKAAIHLAVQSNAVEIVKMLVLKKGVDVNIQNMYQETALHVACNDRRHDIAQFLLRHGADPHIKDRWGREPNCVLEMSFKDSDMSELREKS